MSDVVDITRIRETSDGDIEFEVELIEMYLDDARVHIGLIKEHMTGDDASGLKQSAHTLKGSSANIGAVAVQAAAFELEKAGADGNMAGLESHYAALSNAFNQTEVYFREYLDSLN